MCITILKKNLIISFDISGSALYFSWRTFTIHCEKPHNMLTRRKIHANCSTWPIALNGIEVPISYHHDIFHWIDYYTYHKVSGDLSALMQVHNNNAPTI